MTDSLLIGLAMLRANWDHNEHSFIDNFVPFVADCLRDAPSSEGTTPAEVQACVRRRFGIDIPRGALETVLRRATRRNLARRSDGRFYPEPEAIDRVPLERKREDVTREIEWLISRFVDYLRVSHGEDWPREQAEAALRGYVENWSVSLLRESLSGRKPDQEHESQREADYLVSSFVVHLRGEEPVGFEYLERLVRASMLTAGLYLDQESMERPFTNLTAYLDSPFLLALLGINGSEEQEAAKELVALATELGVEVACFPTTLSEVRGVLNGTARDLRSRRRAGSHVRLHPRLAAVQLTAIELEELADMTERSLREHGVGMRALPRATPAGTTDSAALEQTLQQTVGYASSGTREHDAECLAAVHQIRSGQLQVQMDRARAIFITTNPRVVEASEQHFRPGGDPLTAPVAMMDHAFATVLWLKKPTAAPDLPWKQLIADCHAALNPDDGLWNRYLDEIDALAERDDLDEDTYFLMRHGHEARAALMERTRGRNDRLDSRSVLDIVADARSHIQAPLTERAAEAERRAQDAEAKIHHLRTLTEEARLAAAERESAGVQEAQQRARIESAELLADHEAARLAERFARSLQVGVGLLVGAVVWFVLSGSELAPTSIRLLGVPAAILTIFGTSLPTLIDRVRAALVRLLRPRILRRLRSQLGQDAGLIGSSEGPGGELESEAA